MEEDFQPLTDIWAIYTQSLNAAVEEGYIDDEELALDYVWPQDLKFLEYEKTDVKKYVHERMAEVIDRIKNENGLDPNLIGGYIFRSVLCGMLWEKERTG